MRSIKSSYNKTKSFNSQRENQELSKEALAEVNAQIKSDKEEAARKEKANLRPKISLKQLGVLASLQSNQRDNGDVPQLMQYDERRGLFTLTYQGVICDVCVHEALRLSTFEAFTRLRYAASEKPIDLLHGEDAAPMWRLTASARRLSVQLQNSMCNGLGLEAWEEVRDVCRTALVIRSLKVDEKMFHSLYEVCTALETRADNWLALFKSRTSHRLDYLREGISGIVRERATKGVFETTPTFRDGASSVKDGDDTTSSEAAGSVAPPPPVPPPPPTAQLGGTSNGIQRRQTPMPTNLPPISSPPRAPPTLATSQSAKHAHLDDVLDKGVAKLGTVLVKLLHTVADKMEESHVLFDRAFDPYYPQPIPTDESPEDGFQRPWVDDEGVAMEHIHMLYMRLVMQFEMTRDYVLRVFTSAGISMAAVAVPDIERASRNYSVPSFRNKHIQFNRLETKKSLKRTLSDDQIASRVNTFDELRSHSQPSFANAFLITECATTAQLMEQYALRRAFAVANMLRINPRELTAKGMRMLRSCLFEYDILDISFGEGGDAVASTRSVRTVLREYCYRVFLFALGSALTNGLRRDDIITPTKWSQEHTVLDGSHSAQLFQASIGGHISHDKDGSLSSKIPSYLRKDRPPESMCFLVGINDNFHILPVGNETVPARLQQPKNTLDMAGIVPPSSKGMSSLELIKQRFHVRSRMTGSRNLPCLAPLQARSNKPRPWIERAHAWVSHALFKMHEAKRIESFHAMCAPAEELTNLRDSVLGNFGSSIGGPPLSIAALVQYRKKHSIGQLRLGFITSFSLRRLVDVYMGMHTHGQLGATSAINGMAMRILHEYAAATGYKTNVFPESFTIEQLLSLYSDGLNVMDAATALISATDRPAVRLAKKNQVAHMTDADLDESAESGSMNDIMKNFQQAMQDIDPDDGDSLIGDDAGLDDKTISAATNKGKLAYNALMFVSLQEKLSLQLGLVMEKVIQELSSQAYAIFLNPEHMVPHGGEKQAAPGSKGRNAVAPMPASDNAWNGGPSDSDAATEATHLVGVHIAAPVVKVLHMLDTRVRDNILPSTFCRWTNGVLQMAEAMLAAKRGSKQRQPPGRVANMIRTDCTHLYNIAMNAYVAGEERRRFYLVEDVMRRMNAVADILDLSSGSSLPKSADILPDASHWVAARDGMKTPR